jgi:hypothetical protein
MDRQDQHGRDFARVARRRDDGGNSGRDPDGGGEDPAAGPDALARRPAGDPRHRNAGHAVYTIVREEGIGTLY